MLGTLELPSCALNAGSAFVSSRIEAIHCGQLPRTLMKLLGKDSDEALSMKFGRPGPTNSRLRTELKMPRAMAAF